MNNTRADYQKQKKREYRKNHKTVSLSYPNAEAKILIKEAEQHSLKLHEYLRQCIVAYREQLFIIPDPKKVHHLDIQMVGIATNVNQIARRCNQGQIPAEMALGDIKAQLKILDDYLRRMFSQPWNLEDYLRSAKEKNPEKLQQILLNVLSQ